jgi:hypothetical protein
MIRYYLQKMFRFWYCGVVTPVDIYVYKPAASIDSILGLNLSIMLIREKCMEYFFLFKLPSKSAGWVDFRRLSAVDAICFNERTAVIDDTSELNCPSSCKNRTLLY